MSDKYIQDAEEYKLRDIFDKLSVGIAVVNRDGFVVYANEADCRFLGYSLQELKGMHFKEFTHPDDLPKTWTCIRNL